MGALGVFGGRRWDLGVSGTTWVDARGEFRATGWEASSFLLTHAPRGARTSPLPVLLLRQEPGQLVPQVPSRACTDH